MATDPTTYDPSGFVAENAQASIAQYTPRTIGSGPELRSQLNRLAEEAVDAISPNGSPPAPARGVSPAIAMGSLPAETQTHGAIRVLR